MNIQAINLELAKIGYKATPIGAKKGKQERQPWPLGPRVPGKPKFRSKWYKTSYGRNDGYSWVDCGKEPIKGSACYKSRIPLCQSNWPSDIAAFYAGKKTSVPEYATHEIVNGVSYPFPVPLRVF